MGDRAVVFCLAGLLSSDGPVHIGLLRAFTGFPEDGQQDDDLPPGFQKLIRQVVRSSATRSS
jgi:hypothetical protein